MINNNMIEEYCPRCDGVETWDHITQCVETIPIRKQFIEKLLVKLLKHKNKVNVNEIMSFCEDIMKYLENDDDDKYETNQYLVGIKELFRGYLVIDWVRTNMNCKKYCQVNMIIVKECVKFYNKCWKYLNEVLHDENKKRTIN